MRILNLEPLRYGEEARRVLAAAGEVHDAECGGQRQMLEALGSGPFEAVLTRLGLAFDAKAFDAVPRLRWLATPTTGLAHIDLEEASRRGVAVLSLRGEVDFLRSVSSTAEHAWGLLLALGRRTLPAHADVVAGRWRREPFLGRELSGRTLGLVGCGRLGRMVAGYGVAFDMEVLAFDRASGVSEFPPGVRAAALDELLAAADVVSLHLPLTSETEGLLDASRLRRLRRGALLVNTARGELLDETALLEALQDGHLGGAALDVLAGDSSWNGEVPAGHPLVEYARRRDNLLLTPHIGGYGESALDRTRLFLAEKLLAASAASR